MLTEEDLTYLKERPGGRNKKTIKLKSNQRNSMGANSGLSNWAMSGQKNRSIYDEDLLNKAARDRVQSESSDNTERDVKVKLSP